MDNIEKIITISSTALGFVATVIGLLIPLVKNIKTKNRLSAIKKLTSTLQSLIIDAEAFVNFTGTEKKEYVMTKANRYAIENRIPFYEQDVSEKIEDLIKISKEVNKRETPHITETPISDTTISIRI